MRETNRPTHKDTHIKKRKQVEYPYQGLAKALLKINKQWKLPNYTNRSIWHHQRQTSAQQVLLLYKKSGVFSSHTIKTNCLNRQCRKVSRINCPYQFTGPHRVGFRVVKTSHQLVYLNFCINLQKIISRFSFSSETGPPLQQGSRSRCLTGTTYKLTYFVKNSRRHHHCRHTQSDTGYT